MEKYVELNGKKIGEGHPVYIVAEIGINHNGSVETAKKLIDLANLYGCDAVKFQKRTPEICVPQAQRSHMRETPWGYISYMEYRERVEFQEKEYDILDKYCKEKGITWFASPWDIPSVEFLEKYNVPCHKVPSACLTNLRLLERIQKTGRPILLSTGMSTMAEIERSVSFLRNSKVVLLHSHSCYPSDIKEINLKCIATLREKFQCPVGYSGHEPGLPPSIAAVAMGAVIVERHITLDRTMWGSDHPASLSPSGIEKLVRYIRATELSLGDGKKRVWESEMKAREQLRGK